ncbi:alpha/beta hydrolase family protein [Shewanella kaireitica]|uniref:alpha/beta hydrolase family protein n=1 Tax=Shewanella kaireitica TaxID=212021 RepID=UPI00200F47EB|nr:S9 family peptidase [Shewanella kaireitica]MCL1093850.1 S9 family peptidase [Shewanella kaireitica]
MKRISIFIVAFLMLQITPTIAQQLPVEAFGSIPDVSHVTLSPNGNKLASVIRLDKPKLKGAIIQIWDIENNKKSYPVQTDNKKFVILDLNWSGNDILLIKAKFPALRYGTPTTETRLIKYVISEKQTASAIPRQILKRLKHIPQFQSAIIDMLPEDENQVLLELSGSGTHSRYESVLKLNLNGGRSKYVQKAKRNISRWITDRQHNIRVGIYRDETEYRIYEQAEANSDMRILWQFEAFEKEQIWPLGFAQDPNILYVSAYHNDLTAIFKVNLKDPLLKKELVYSDTDYDVEGSLIYSHLKKKVIGINVGSESEYTFWDPEYVAIQNGLEAALPNSNNYITQFSDDERRYLVYSTSSTESGTYYLADRDNKAIYPVAQRYSSLSKEVLAETKTLSYKARDGLEIQAFLTTPLNTESTKLPIVIFPHGGPISYDSNSFDYWAQFFANRGYGVFRMNFRGSSGYGHSFMKAGLQNWGLEMQNDVEDGTRWLIDQGIADPNRICIVGASYGGYAALMGVATTPDLYQCAVSVAGVTDVEYLVKSSRRYSNHEIVKKQVGEDYDALYQRSPISQAEKIKVPILLIHGTKDRVVRFRHSEEMFDELEDHDKNVELIELEDGDHYLSSNEHRLTTFKALDRFLAQHLNRL